MQAGDRASVQCQIPGNTCVRTHVHTYVCTHTHTNTHTDQGAVGPAAAGHQEETGVWRHFSPSVMKRLPGGTGPRSWVSALGAHGLSQGGLDGGHQLQELALRVHVAIAALLRVNQLPRYRDFKKPGDLGRPLAADVQAPGELILQLLLELKILGLVASGSTVGGESGVPQRGRQQSGRGRGGREMEGDRQRHTEGWGAAQRWGGRDTHTKETQSQGDGETERRRPDPL